MQTKIIRNDRGLDFRRIEQFIKMFQEKCRRKSGEISKQESAVKKERTKQAFEHFGLTAEIEAIKAIEAQIEELKKQQENHEEKVRDFTQGTDRKNRYNRYNSYDTIREGSPISQYIDEACEQFKAKKDEVWALNESLSQEIWFSRDLEQAIEIIQKFQCRLEETVKGAAENVKE